MKHMYLGVGSVDVTIMMVVYDNGVIKDGKQDYASNANLTDFIVDDEPVDSTMHCKQENFRQRRG